MTDNSTMCHSVLQIDCIHNLEKSPGKLIKLLSKPLAYSCDSKMILPVFKMNDICAFIERTRIAK